MGREERRGEEERRRQEWSEVEWILGLGLSVL